METTQKQEIIEAYENDNRIQMQKQMDAEHIQEAMFISTHQPGITTAFAVIYLITLGQLIWEG